MKKALLSVCVLAASALAANAQGTVWFSEDFSWAEPYVKEFGLGDPVGTDNAETKGARLDGQSDQTIDGKNVYNQFWDVRGYRMRNWPNANWYDQWIYNCYWGGGSEQGQNAGMRFPAIPDAPADPDAAYVSFDWCPYKSVETGEYDEVTLHLQTRPGDVNNPTLLTHDLKKGDPMKWIHVELDFYDAEGATFNNTTNFMIEPVLEQQKEGHHRFYLDNFMVHSEKADAGVNGVSVDQNAPVEYYNLQGIRVNNPENGLYIRRQGKKSSKVLFK